MTETLYGAAEAFFAAIGQLPFCAAARQHRRQEEDNDDDGEECEEVKLLMTQMDSVFSDVDRLETMRKEIDGMLESRHSMSATALQSTYMEIEARETMRTQSLRPASSCRSQRSASGSSSFAVSAPEAASAALPPQEPWLQDGQSSDSPLNWQVSETTAGASTFLTQIQSLEPAKIVVMGPQVGYESM